MCLNVPFPLCCAARAVTRHVRAEGGAGEHNRVKGGQSRGQTTNAVLQEHPDT